MLLQWINQDKHTGSITLSQKAYCEQLLDCFGISNCAPTSTLLPTGVTSSIEDYPITSEEIDEMTNILYHEALGRVMWLQVATRPDLTYAVNVLSRFSHNPGRQHWKALKHTLLYIKGTSHYGIMYKGDGNLDPVGYVDSDFAGCRDIWRSTEGNIFIVAEGLVSWESKRQETAALSTVEAKYMAFTQASTQAIWLTKFLSEVSLPERTPIPMFANNQGSIANTTNGKNHQRTKYIDIKHHFVKERAKSGEVSFEYILSAENLADIFTKPLLRDTH